MCAQWSLRDLFLQNSVQLVLKRLWSFLPEFRTSSAEFLSCLLVYNVLLCLVEYSGDFPTVGYNGICYAKVQMPFMWYLPEKY